MRVPRTEVPELEPLIRSWHLSRDHHEWAPGATDQQIEQAERAVNKRFPRALRAVYEISNGIGLVGGNLNFDPLVSSRGHSLADLAKMLRQGSRKAPDELLLFGNDGSESIFGLWLPGQSTELKDCPVIELGEDQCGMAIAGTSLCRFLRWRTGYYLLLEEANPKSLDALGLPVDLRVDEFDDDHLARLIHWADPEILDPNPDPYKRPVTIEELRNRFGS